MVADGDVGLQLHKALKIRGRALNTVSSMLLV